MRISFPTSGDEKKINYKDELCEHPIAEADNCVEEEMEMDGNASSVANQVQALPVEMEQIEESVETLELD